MSDSDTSGFNIPYPACFPKYEECLTLIFESGRGYSRLFTTIRNGRRIVLKALKEEYRTSETHIELLKKEFFINSRLYHPNIIGVYDLINHPTAGVAIEMEYFDGITLDKFLKKDHKKSYGSVYRILQQLCSAVSYMHSHGIIHRDLKPKNIMITKDGSFLKIIDFGLSDETSYVTPQLAGGTKNYSAPEQFEPGYCKADQHADIYAIGQIMADLKPNAHGGYLKVLKKCISHNPSDRPNDAENIIPYIKIYDRKRRAIIFSVALCIAAVMLTITMFTTKEDSVANHNLPRVDTIATTSHFDHEDINSQNNAEILTTDLSSDKTSDNLNIPSIAPTVSTSEGTSSLPFEEKAYLKCLELSGKYFHDHLNTIDTMKNIRTCQLAKVGYWRHLTKQDFSKWLTLTISKDSPYYHQMMEEASKAIADYEREHKASENKAWSKRGLLIIVTKYTEDLGDGWIQRHTLEEDGTWTIEKWDDLTEQALQRHRY